jgi:hypothetical protein
MSKDKLNKNQEVFIKRSAIYLAENNLELNDQNINLAFKSILNRDKELLKQKKVIAKVLAPKVWGKIQKQRIDEKVNQQICFNIS